MVDGVFVRGEAEQQFFQVGRDGGVGFPGFVVFVVIAVQGVFELLA